MSKKVASDLLRLAKQVLGRRGRGEPLEFQLVERKFMKAVERVLRDLELTVDAEVDADVYMVHEGTPDGWISPGEPAKYDYEAGGAEMEYIKPNNIPIKNFLRLTQKYYKMPNIDPEKIEYALADAFEKLSKSKSLKDLVYCKWESSGGQYGELEIQEPVFIELDGDDVVFSFVNESNAVKEVDSDVGSQLSEYDG